MSEINGIICEFLEIFVHNILHKRRLYSETIFTKQTKYSIIIYKSIYPHLNDYIENVMKAINFHLDKNNLKKVIVSFESDGRTIERHVVDVINFTNNPLKDCRDPFYLKLEQCIRSFMLKLENVDLYLSPLPEDCNFTINLMVKEESFIKFNDNPQHDTFPWMNGEDLNEKNFSIIPMDQIKCDQFHLQFYVEKCN